MQDQTGKRSAIVNKEDIVSVLAEIDARARFVYDAHGEVVLVGSAALILQGLSIGRTTRDVDVIAVRGDSGISEAVFADERVNDRSAAYCQNIPYNYEERLAVFDIGSKNVRFLLPSIEDLAIMKLYRWGDQDVSDLVSSDFSNKADWELLELLAYDRDEAAGSRSALPENDRELKQMRFNYESLKERCGKKI